MGHARNKTVDYYRNIDMVSSILDEEFKIQYHYNNKSYILMTCSSRFDQAIEYILSYNTPIVESNVLFAYSRSPEGIVKDITELVKMYEGPSADFNHSNSFFILANQISEHDVYILTKDQNMLKFEDSDIIYLVNPSLNITEYFNTP
jgi:hypothetical protein